MRTRRAAAGITVVVVALALAACGTSSGSSASASGSSALRLADVSGRATMASGGSVLVEATGTAVAPGALHFAVDGHDVTSSTTVGTRGGRTLALVSGITDGAHTIRASAKGASATLPVHLYPIDGPIFSGPHLPLPVCTTQDAGLGPPTDANCSAPTKVMWRYRSTDGSFKPLAGPSERPADLATATVNGVEMPYVVREEEGVIDRAIYWMSALDPTGTASPVETDPGWNGRLVYVFGGGCGTTYSQGTPLAVTTLDDGLLSHGYAVATATFNTFQVQCNPVLSAETAMMVKEHFAKTFGPPTFTIGNGGSGGAIQQLMIAQAYPGILDAIAPAVPFPDALTTAKGVTDCGLLARYYSTRGTGWTAAQQAAVNGHETTGTCALWIQSFLSGIDPSVGCDGRIPKSQIYSAANPKGLRCTLQDENRNELGVDPRTGFAYRPLDNVGVQYGFDALNAGLISVDQFLDLNQHVGGYDIDGHVTPQREVAPLPAVSHAYATGAIDEGGGDLRKIPVLLVNNYTDPLGDIHTRFWVFAIRDRLTSPGAAPPANVSIWTQGLKGSLVQNLAGSVGSPITTVSVLDQWLTSGVKPAAAQDTCTLPDGTVMRGDAVYDGPNACTAAYPYFGDARIAAGEPLRDDVVKCQLTPPQRAAYKVAFTDQQWGALQQIFPDGVCDWSRPSAGFTPLEGTWLSFGS